MFDLGLEKAEEPEIKLPASVGSLKKQENSKKKKIYVCFIDYAKTFECVNHNKLWKILKEMGILDHLTSLLRNLDTGQEATEPNMEQQTGSKLEYVKKGVCHVCILSPSLFNLYAEYII